MTDHFKMARDKDFAEVKLIPEMPKPLKELLEIQSNRLKTNGSTYETLDFCWKEAKSALSFNDKFPLPPSMLTREEKEQMRKYRREAVKCEQKLFERRREKYSSLLLQVMAVSDRMQEKELYNNKNSEYDKSEDVYGNKEHSNQSYKTPFQEEKENQKESFYNQEQLQSVRNIKSTTDVKPSTFSMGDCPAGVGYTKPQTHGNMVSNEYQPNVRASVLRQNLSDDVSVDTSISNKTSTLNESTASKRDSLASTSLSCAYYTDCSITSSVHPESTKSAQRKLILGEIDENHNDTCVKPQSFSESRTLNNVLLQPKKMLNMPKSQEKLSSVKSSEPLLGSQQNLDLIKQELQEEKTKLLKQQVLSRLRYRQSPEEQSFVSHDETTDLPEIVQTRLRNPADERRPKMPSRNSYTVDKSFYHDDTPNQLETNSADERKPIMPTRKSYSVEEYCHDSPNQLDINFADERKPKVPYRKSYSVDESYDAPDQIKSKTTQGIDFHKIPTEELHLHLPSYAHSDSHVVNVKQFSKNHPISEASGSEKVLEKEKFDIVSAFAKGFLTRLLLKADKVQALIKTVKDTQELLDDIAKEGGQSSQDKTLQDRVYAQFQAAKISIYDIFHTIPVSERMAYISHSRNLAKERETKKAAKRRQTMGSSLSAATMKAIQRRNSGHTSSQDKKPEMKKRSTSPLSNRKNWDIRFSTSILNLNLRSVASDPDTLRKLA